MIEQELLGYLLAAAVSLSGYAPVDPERLPPIQQLPHGSIVQEVCPEAPANCRGLVAVFDTDGYRILVDSSLDLDQPADNSFLVHELVHVLQYRQNGERIFASCQATLRTEQEAYRVQNAYLKREGQLMRVGEALRFIGCAERTGLPAP